MRTSPYFYGHFGFATRLNYQWTIGIHTLFYTVVLHPSIPIRAQIIKPHRIGLKGDNTQQFRLELNILRGINLAFKNGVLNTLTIIEADFCRPTQTAATFARLGIDVISY